VVLVSVVYQEVRFGVVDVLADHLFVQILQ
jgi:hypothetical protein